MTRGRALLDIAAGLDITERSAFGIITAAVRPRSVITVPLWPKLVSMLPGVPPAANAGWVTPAETSEAATTAAAARMPLTDMGGLS
jgi:hypothetical protein